MSTKTFVRISALLTTLGVLMLTSVTASANDEFRLDPQRVQGPDVCADCHEYNVDAWRETHHFTTFKELPSRPEAREIADKMGLKRIKEGSDCLGCHFTAKPDDSGRVKTIAGITCESCHGPAINTWISTLILVVKISPPRTRILRTARSVGLTLLQLA